MFTCDTPIITNFLRNKSRKEENEEKKVSAKWSVLLQMFDVDECVCLNRGSESLAT